MKDGAPLAGRREQDARRNSGADGAADGADELTDAATEPVDEQDELAQQLMSESGNEPFIEHSDKQAYTDDEQEYLFDDEYEDEEDDEPYEPPARRKWVAKTAAVLLVMALLGNVLAFWPKLYNMQVIEFLRTTRALSQDEAVQGYKQAIVVVRSGDRKGTGFNIDERGLIVTNRHVVEGTATAVVAFPDGQLFRASVAELDRDLDIAVLRIDSVPELPLPTLPLANDAAWSIGMSIYFIGNPLLYNNIVGQGTILGLTGATGSSLPVMAIDAPVYSGNSGSPVITEDGNVIAVIYATATLEVDGERQKVGLAVPLHHYEGSSLFDY